MRECEDFLAWALPQLGLNHAGFRRLQKCLCKELRRRRRTLKLAGLAAYRDYLTHNPEEWQTLDGFCRISISRFFRNRPIFDELHEHHLPRLALAVRNSGGDALRCCCVGIASGEEPYSVRLLWDWHLREQFPEVELTILGLDADPNALERARCACYRASSLQELRPDELDRAFQARDDWFELKTEFRGGVEFRFHDIRKGLPDGPYDLILCRNLAFTYFDRASQLGLLDEVAEQLQPGGVFVIGSREFLPSAQVEVGFDSGSLPGLFTYHGVAGLISA